jgi:glycosyltransferase involved in cell wall biosynthesis
MEKKRIMIVIGSFKIGGAERMSINVGEELLRRGYDVHYVLQKNIIELKHSIPQANIHILNKKVASSKYMHHMRNLVGVMAMQFRLRPDVVMAFTYFSSFLACFTFSKRIIGRFDINPFHLKRKARHRISDFVANWPFVHRIVVPSYGLGKSIAARSNRFEEKITVIHNSIDLQKIRLMTRELSDIPPIAQPYIAAMGRLTGQKNFSLLLHAYAKSNIRNKMRLVIIGDGEFLSRLKVQTEELKISDRVIFTGFSKNPFPIIQQSAVFVNTSTFESFCNVILEALSVGVPVVASNCPFGPAEIIEQGANGYLFNTRSEEELVAIFNAIEKDPETLNKLKAQTIATSEKFSLKTIGDQWQQLIESVV